MNFNSDLVGCYLVDTGYGLSQGGLGLADLLGIAELYCQKSESTKWLNTQNEEGLA